MARTSRTLLALTTALGTAAAAIALTAAPASAAGARGAACDPKLVAPQGSLIGAHWRSLGGERSVHGCPVTKEYGFAGKRGSYQEYRNGRIVWSPNLGEGALLRAYQSGNRAVFRWSGLGRDWDYFNVRYSRNGGPATQVEVRRLTPWSGIFSLNTCPGLCSTTSGHATDRYAFVVQGCDRGLFGSDCGPWSITTSVKVSA
jgi:hypothetical protein